MSKERLFELAAAADEQLHQFASTMPEDYYEPGYPVVNKKYRSDLYKRKAVAAGIGVAGAGAAGMAYQNRDKLAPMAKGAVGYGLKTAAKGADKVADTMLRGGLYGPFKQGGRGTEMLYKGANKAAGMGRVLRKAAQSFSTGTIERIVELAARIDALETGHEFSDDEKRGWERTHTSNRKAGAGMALAGAAGIGAGYAGAKYGKQGYEQAAKYGKQGYEQGSKYAKQGYEQAAKYGKQGYAAVGKAGADSLDKLRKGGLSMKAAAALRLAKLRK